MDWRSFWIGVSSMALVTGLFGFAACVFTAAVTSWLTGERVVRIGPFVIRFREREEGEV